MKWSFSFNFFVKLFFYNMICIPNPKLLRNELNFCSVHGIMNTLGLMQTLQETRCIHDSMNRSKNEFIAYNCILL